MSLREQLRPRFADALVSAPSADAALACVAVILRGTNLENLEVGYIRRATRDLDRWSGQIAFPGGHAEPGDATPIETAVRETREEIGLQLRADALIGALDDIQARKAGQLLDFFIRPFVFFHEEPFEPLMDPREIADFFWVPVTDLRDQNRRIEYELSHGQITLKLPAIRMSGDPPLWGLTYLMTQNLLLRLNDGL